tara:strand:+ start:7618 stop:8418 length:801 start_codon:yes stop_codon:yes gene_type:complete
MNKNEVLNWLKKTDLSLTSISKRTNISRSTLYNWIEGKEMSDRSFNKILSIYKKEIKLLNTKIELKGATHMIRDRNVSTEIDSSSYIDKLHRIIKYQEQDIERLKSKPSSKMVEKELYNNIASEVVFKIDLHINFKKMIFGRNIQSVQGVDVFSEKLGYDLNTIRNDIFCIGEYYGDLDDHPVNNYITKDSEKSLKRLTKSFLSSLSLFKKLITNDKDYFIDLDITYIAKDGSLVETKSFNWVEIDFKDGLHQVHTKLIFLEDAIN